MEFAQDATKATKSTPTEDALQNQPLPLKAAVQDVHTVLFPSMEILQIRHKDTI